MSDLTYTALRPSRRLWQLRLTQTCMLILVAAVLAAIVGVALDSAATLVILLAVVAIAGTLTATLVRRRYRAWAYEEREEDLVVSRGVMFRRQSVVPYGRMQFVDVTAGPFERVFGIATVKLHTAAAATDARIPGLARDEAARLRDRLAALGEAKASGL